MALINSGYKVEWKGTQLGDHAYITYEYTGNTDLRIIPRGKGVRIWSTKELGGGFLKIKVLGVIARVKRIDVEEYFIDLDSNLELNEKGDLVITDKDSNTYTLTDCYLQNYVQSEEDLRLNTFSAIFIMSL